MNRPTLAFCAASTSLIWSGRACALMAEMTTSKPGNRPASSSTGAFRSPATTLTPRFLSSSLLVFETEVPRVMAVISYGALAVRNGDSCGGLGLTFCIEWWPDLRNWWGTRGGR